VTVTATSFTHAQVFDRVLLAVIPLQWVRCEHCFRRQYVNVLCRVEYPQHCRPFSVTTENGDLGVSRAALCPRTDNGTGWAN
jgi:hypothetical protein